MTAISFDPLFFAVAVPAMIFAGVSKAGFGSGPAFAAMTILALVLDPAVALGLTLPLLMLVDAVTLRPYWRRWDWPAARDLIVGALPGVALGAALYRIADADVFRILIGVVALGFVGFRLAVHWQAIPARARPFGSRVGLLAGAVAGFTSFVSHAGGPPVAVYLLAGGLGKTTYQATTVLVFWAINIFKFVPYAFLGIFTADTMLGSAVLAPAALFGAWLGVRAHHVVPERLFFSLAYAALALSGAKLLWDGLT
ncbi:Integal membrane protein (Rhomboid family) [Rhodovulum sp. P5]|uniref:sulfite exporter TauE/SafE family protein n=1 Tax=Rhodovulum sp. P5 TaxID=1564506 RepID=UPI0009C36FA8|nr:sulfite exporter TauE/SafE family protein [Rhodovulum sp. P5]ARE38765.1 Integal membrane protein (Rhomboid family) [Rhodovulum sp. P5]